ncbi:hypothetical protein A2U01_0034671, partial [Trifolium medium]|nr:hypothetical protein [Trifolium medium]
GPPSTFANYTPLNKSREAILAECNSSEFTKAGIKFLKQPPPKPNQDRSRYCRYHKSYGHLIEDCIQLKDAIEILIRNRQLREFVKRKENSRPENVETSAVEEVQPAATGQKVALCVSQPEDFVVLDHFEDSYVAPTLNEWENFPEAMAKGRSVPLAFYLEELPGGSANSQIPLLVRADMANYDVRRMLVDPGSSCDI